MSDAAACYGCGARLPRALLEDVGDTVFCRDCLAGMRRRSDERRARGAVPAASQARGSTGLHVDAGATERAPASAAAADAPCFVCGGALDGPTLFELRGFAICGACARGLIGDRTPTEDAPALESARAAVTGDAEETLDGEIDGAIDGTIEGAIESEADGATGGAAQAAPRSVLPEGSSRVVATPGSGTEWCSRCGRAMPGPGSYQLVEGRPTCPACVAAHAQRTARAQGSAQDATPSPEPGEACACDARGVCDACSGPIDPAVRETQGFRLCAACLHSDPELALAIARSRHQRRLARAGRRLLEGEDD